MTWLKGKPKRENCCVMQFDTKKLKYQTIGRNAIPLHGKDIEIKSSLL